jgi:serine/threonine protein phosphatase PrpC
MFVHILLFILHFELFAHLFHRIALSSRNFTAQAMSVDHKPGREDESKRIRDAGGFVINNRVMGELAVSRAFGDSEFKKGIQSIIGQDELLKNENGDGEENKNWDQPLVIAEPDIQVVTINEDDQFVLLACDGLYDVFTNEEVVSFVLAQMTEHADSLRCCQVTFCNLICCCVF